MSELIIPPSPNWFLSDCLSVGADGYVLYGTLSTDIAILIPTKSSPLYFSNVKIIQPAHKDRVTCISLCPNWLSTRLFISGADDGYVKLWNAETYTCHIAHNTHTLKKETVVGVVFLDASRVLSIGSLSMLALWNTKSNHVQRDQQVLKFFRPICMSVCPHKPNTVAVGTRQGVVVVLSISDKITILYKAPGHNAEITSLSWCPTVDCEYLDTVSSMSKTLDKSSNTGARQYACKPGKSVQDRLFIPENSNADNSTKIIRVKKPKIEMDEFLKDCQDALELIKLTKGSEVEETCKATPQVKFAESFDEFGRSKYIPKIIKDDLNDTINRSVKLNETLPTEEELNNEAADESDIFDIYADHEADEFGHTKFKPENEHGLAIKRVVAIIEETKPEVEQIPVKENDVVVESVPIVEESKPVDENHSESKVVPEKENEIAVESIVSVIDESKSVEKTSDDVLKQNEIDVLSDNISSLKLQELGKDGSIAEKEITKKTDAFYLASCCKNGFLCIWRWGGTLVLSQTLNKSFKKKLNRKVTHPFGAIHWYKSSELIAASKESLLIKMKFTLDEIKFTNLHNEHKRGLFRITSNVKSATVEDNFIPVIWTASMDRLLAGHLINNNFTNIYSTLGGFVYDIQISPIDSITFAVGAGDGAIRIWRLVHTKSDECVKVKFVKQFWNGISGKVLKMAWHPTREKCLAFTTYEGRIGLLDVASENPAKLFPISLSLGAFRICWDSKNHLFACGGDMLVVYDATHLNKESQPVDIIVSDEKWEVSTMLWTEKYLCVGSPQGGFALMKPQHPYEFVVATYPHKKRIQSIEWHPAAVSTEEDESPYSNLVAVTSNTRNLIVLKVTESEGETKLEVYLDLEIHADNIISICWSPHHNGRILSTSKDYTVQVWDVINKCLLHTFADHQDPALSAVWCPLSTRYVMSSGGDYTLRIWNVNKYPPKENVAVKRKQKKKSTLAKMREFDENLATLQMENEELTKSNLSEDNSKTVNVDECETLELAIVSKASDKKSHKKNFPLVKFWKNYRESQTGGCRRLFDKIKSDNVDEVDYSDGFEYLKIYGKRSIVMEILDDEQSSHKETYNWNALSIIGVLCGDLRGAFEYAALHSKLTTSLLCLAPSISHRFWKEMLKSYNSQMEGEDGKKSQDASVDSLGKIWQGMIYLSSGLIEEGCMAFSAAGLHAEAICAARARQADHIAEKHLKIWSDANIVSSNYNKAAECLLSLGLVKEAANVLGKSNEETELALAAEIAKHGGNSILANSLLNND